MNFPVDQTGGFAKNLKPWGSMRWLCDVRLVEKSPDCAHFFRVCLRNVNNEESMQYLLTTLDELMKESR